MLRRLVITASVAGACAVCAPASYHRADAAVFSANAPQTPASLVELVRDGRGGGGGGMRIGGGGRSGGGGSAFGGRSFGGGSGSPMFRSGGGFGGRSGGPVFRGNSLRSGNFGAMPSLRSGMGSRRFNGGNIGSFEGRPRGPIVVGPGYSRRSIGGGDGYRRRIGDRGIIVGGDNVRRPGKHAWGGDWGGKHHGKRHHRRHRGSRVFWAAGWPLYYYNDYAYTYTCEELREQALETASLYWWKRYQECLDYTY
jgi:hypothetical protein